MHRIWIKPVKIFGHGPAGASPGFWFGGEHQTKFLWRRKNFGSKNTFEKILKFKNF